ncbi:MAG TPA: putative molybdenum carrier protein [Gemmatimonadales bacterium]|nr:putative molybdenum carrier protein [Gemmatimonadales bacterium]
MREIWSGAQTGVDRAALDAAHELGLITGGWVPLGRIAEDGTIPERYAGLRETETPDYSERTTRNIEDSDATLILYRHRLTCGTAFTKLEAVRLGRPHLAVNLTEYDPLEAAAMIHQWLDPLPGSRLNVAGPRASTDPEIHALAEAVLRAVLAARS